MKNTSTLIEDGAALPILKEILARVTTIENLLLSHTGDYSQYIAMESSTSIYWTASKTDLIELIYGLYANRVFNNGKTTIKDITCFFEEALGMKLGNTSLRFQEILRRKDSIAFLNQVRNALEAYMSRIDDKSAL
ncbi:MAG: RteC domain-containing protein [Sphingobacteriia bacterium]|nr:RteC domain-containing protein [Sphingobacteriia bacterium]